MSRCKKIQMFNIIDNYKYCGQHIVVSVHYSAGTEFLLCSKTGDFVKNPYVLVESIGECNVYRVVVVQFVFFAQFVNGEVNK